jgi:hypothetical protein
MRSEQSSRQRTERKKRKAHLLSTSENRFKIPSFI